MKLFFKKKKGRVLLLESISLVHHSLLWLHLVIVLFLNVELMFLLSAWFGCAIKLSIPVEISTTAKAPF